MNTISTAPCDDTLGRLLALDDALTNLRNTRAKVAAALQACENLLLGAHMRKDTEAVRTQMDGIYRQFPNLGERRNMLASCLSGGEQQMLAIGRALLAQPQIMMLDEPSLGLSPLFVEKLFALIVELREQQGISILLVEQNAGKALAIADKALVLELGRVVTQGNAHELLQDTALQRAYLGG